MKKKIATLFSGGELFGIGAQQAGCEHAWGIEYDDKIASVARLNGFNVITGDVRNVDDYVSLPSVDHLHASPPCPNFSVAKKDSGETELDIQLASAVAWFIIWKKPSTFTLENVTAYRKSESLKIILKTLEENGYFVDIQNLNAADFGVPQTRRRMILRASKGLMRSYPSPVKWVGWYEAIEDLIDTLPETKFAQWQLDRLPQEYRNFLIGQGTLSRPMGDDEPAQTITANSNQSGTKAFLVKGQNINPKTFRILQENEPHSTVTASMDKTPSRAFVVNTKEPHVRAYTGRVVKMTVQALGRFQTVPDDYKGLTVKINGNGVPCLMARRIMETFL